MRSNDFTRADEHDLQWKLGSRYEFEHKVAKDLGEEEGNSLKRVWMPDKTLGSH